LHEVLKLNPETILAVGCGIGIYEALWPFWNREELQSFGFNIVEETSSFIGQMNNFN